MLGRRPNHNQPPPAPVAPPEPEDPWAGYIPLPEAIDIVNDEELVLRWIAGTSSTLVVSFTGALNNPDGTPNLEFGRVGSQAMRNHVLFVTDMGKSYYSSAALRRRIDKLVMEFIRGHAITEVHTIGNSMGGYGAILFSEMWGCKTVSAFVPAISLGPEIVDDPVWDELRPCLGPERVMSVASCFERRLNTKYYIVFSDGTADDRRQLKRVPHGPNVETFVYRGVGHTVANKLKQDELIRPVATSMIKGETEKVRQLLLANPMIDRVEGGAKHRFVKITRKPDDAHKKVATEDAGTGATGEVDISADETSTEAAPSTKTSGAGKAGSDT